MTNGVAARLTPVRKLLLAAAAIGALAGPVAIGLLNTSHAGARERFEVRSRIGKAIGPQLARDGAQPDIRQRPARYRRDFGVTLKTLVEFAYGVQDFQIAGGPRWLRTARFDIFAKPGRPKGPPDFREATDAQQKSLWEQLRERTRSLLAERFQLVIHRESKEHPVHPLVLANNGAKLQPSTEDNGISRNRGQITAKGGTMPSLANVLGNVLAHPVLDRTGMSGKYDFRLEWTEESGGAMGKGGTPEGPSESNAADVSGPSIFSAIQQLGLKLEPSKAPVEIIVIDRAEKPSAN